MAGKSLLVDSNVQCKISQMNWEISLKHRYHREREQTTGYVCITIHVFCNITCNKKPRSTQIESTPPLPLSLLLLTGPVCNHQSTKPCDIVRKKAAACRAQR